MKKIYNVYGMHCASCEKTLEAKVGKIKGVNKVHASAKSKRVTIVCGDSLDEKEVCRTITDAGYSLDKKDLPLVNFSPKDFDIIAVCVAIIFVFLVLSKILGLGRYFSFTSTSPSSLGAVALIGLTAGFSTCMAVVGGLVISISALYAEANPSLKPKDKFIPHVIFNLGRVVLFFVFGGLLGAFGSAIKVSSGVNGFLMILVGLSMLFVGVEILKLFPRLPNLLTLPKLLTKKIFPRFESKKYSHITTFFLGGLTFFSPLWFHSGNANICTQ